MANQLHLSSDQQATLAHTHGRDLTEKCPSPWLEATIVDDLQTPLPGEPCVLHVDETQVGPVATDAAGVVRFEKVPDGFAYRLQLLHVLEAWSPDRAAAADWLPKPDDYRKRDGTIHAVQPCVKAAEQVIRVDDLTESEKLAHFCDAYTGNGAYYIESRPNTFGESPPRWNWGRGAVCNQHVNFFLGYWFNYNAEFTTRASAAFMDATTALDSDTHTILVNKEKVKFRGYQEFVEEIPADDYVYPHPSIERRKIHYLRICEASFGGAKVAATSLFTAIGDRNVYSVSDIPKAKRSDALDAVRAWLKQHPERLPPGSTAAGMTPDQLWRVVWLLDAADEIDARLIKTLQGYLNVDHHAGVLFKRDDDLFTFSADGSRDNRQKIVVRRFADHDAKTRKFLHLAIWKTRPLRPGGYAAREAESNAGGISIHNASRFIHWTP